VPQAGRSPARSEPQASEGTSVNFAFSDEQEEFRSVLRRFFEERAPSAELRRMLALPAGFDATLWKQMAAELGLPGIHLPESVGGQGFGFLELGIVLEEMGRALLPSPFFASSVLATEAIRCVADAEEQQMLLPGIASGEEIGALAWVERGKGWDPAALALTARPEADGYVLDGAKHAVLSGDAATRLLVAARLPDTRAAEGLTLLHLEANAPGVRVVCEEPIDLTRHLARVELDGARALALGTPGNAAAGLAKALRRGAVALSAEMIGGAARALEMAVAYAKQRVQFGRAIGSFQALKHAAAEVLLEVELARSASYWAWWVAEQDGPELAEAAPLAKSACAEAYSLAAATNVQIHGGIGFTFEADPQLHYRRARADAALLGDPGAQRAALAQELGL
jgi:alkylation response protein AidB-like acyl-CoA dehydrogenase